MSYNITIFAGSFISDVNPRKFLKRDKDHVKIMRLSESLVALLVDLEEQ